MFLVNPVFGMLFNSKLKRWHPILLKESPMPGPDSKSVRLKSVGHHTTGFERREDAVKNIEENCKEVEPTPTVDIEKDIPWDGNGLPVIVCLFAENKIIL